MSKSCVNLPRVDIFQKFFEKRGAFGTAPKGRSQEIFLMVNKDKKPETSLSRDSHPKHKLLVTGVPFKNTFRVSNLIRECILDLPRSSGHSE